jgi:hypothetical protein
MANDEERAQSQVLAFFEPGESLYHSVSESDLIPSPRPEETQMNPLSLEQPPGGLSFDRSTLRADPARVFSEKRPQETRLCQLAVNEVYCEFISTIVYESLARPSKVPGNDAHSEARICRRTNGWPDEKCDPGKGIKREVRFYLAAHMIARPEHYQHVAPGEWREVKAT